MIDFRYHLVSLISVFIALAIGIVLGAGPLRESLGDQLAEQVEQLRTEKDDLRAANEELTADRDQLTGYVEASAPQLLEGTLDGTTIALVTEHDSSRTEVEAVEANIATAGGTVGPRITLQPMLWAPDASAQRRDTLADLRAVSPELVPADADDDVTALTGTLARLLSPGAGPDEEVRAQAWQVLVDRQAVTVDGDLVPVDAVAYLGADPAEMVVPTESASAAAERAQALLGVQTSFMLGLVDAGTPAVVSAVTPEDNSADGILGTVRTDARFRDLSTTDRLQQSDGPVLTVLALGERLRGGVGDYGTAADADARIPEVDSSAPIIGQEEPAASDGGEG